MVREGQARLDLLPAARLLKRCRLAYGEVWEDPVAGHRVGVLDAAAAADVRRLTGGLKARLAVNDPPYNVAVGNANTRALYKVSADRYLEFSRAWVSNVLESLADDAHCYVWMGADYRDGFQPLPEFMLMMRGFPGIRARNLITLRNQRGFGTQKN